MGDVGLRRMCVRMFAYLRHASGAVIATDNAVVTPVVLVTPVVSTFLGLKEREEEEEEEGERRYGLEMMFVCILLVCIRLSTGLTANTCAWV